MMLIDSHCHLDFSAFDHQHESLLQSCKVRNITAFINPSVNPLENQHLQQLCIDHPSIFFAAGLHPWWQESFIKEHDQQAEEMLTRTIVEQSNNIKCVAIGECGLDACIDLPVEKQLPLFELQLQLACELELPIIIHAVKSHNEILRLLKQYRPAAAGVIHGFSGSLQQALSYCELGFYIGVGGTITYERAAKTRKAMQQLPLSKLLLETDAPAIPLSGHQGKDNSPLYLHDVAACLAQLRDEPLQQIYRQTTENCYHLFPKLSA